MNGIRLRDIKKSFTIENKTIDILRGVFLDIKPGEITVLLGRSGCGKTTLLRILAGLEYADKGDVIADTQVKPAVVLQEPGLIPWLNIRDNIAFSIKNKIKNENRNFVNENSLFKKMFLNRINWSIVNKTDYKKRRTTASFLNKKLHIIPEKTLNTDIGENSKKISNIIKIYPKIYGIDEEKNDFNDIDTILREYCNEYIDSIIKMIGVSGFETAYPNQLSLAMQQRVSIGRAFAYDPSFIIMDEPFAAFDYFTRKQLQSELLKIHKKAGMSVLFVTHSINEAFMLADKIALMKDGFIENVYDIKNVCGNTSVYFNAMRKEIVKNLEFCSDI